MRRPISSVLFAGILPAITALAALVPAGPAQAREPVPFAPGVLDAVRYCGFPIFIDPVVNNEYQDVRTLPDGTTITKITGKLVVSFTNQNTGTTIVRDVSGPTTTITHPDGTGTTVGEGNNWWTVGPVSRPIIKEPALLFTTGRAVFVFGPVTGVPFPVASSFSLSGTQVNGCALLAG
jgi:hypothetical protein